MGRRLNLILTREQVRTLHAAATGLSSSEKEEIVRQRWNTIARETARALKWDEQTRTKNGGDV